MTAAVSGPDGYESGAAVRRDCETRFSSDVIVDQYTYMSNAANNHQNAKRVYDSLTGKTKPRMPIDRPYWTKDELDLFKNWMNGGYKP